MLTGPRPPTKPICVMRNLIIFIYLLFFSNFIAGCYRNDDVVLPNLVGVQVTDQSIDCYYQGEFLLAENGITQAETSHGTFIFDPFANTISITSEIQISSIQMLQVDQPAGQCYLINPDFTYEESVCMIIPSHYEFWDCAASNETFFYQFRGICEPAIDTASIYAVR